MAMAMERQDGMQKRENNVPGPSSPSRVPRCDGKTLLVGSIRTRTLPCASHMAEWAAATVSELLRTDLAPLIALLTRHTCCCCTEICTTHTPYPLPGGPHTAPSAAHTSQAPPAVAAASQLLGELYGGVGKPLSRVLVAHDLLHDVARLLGLVQPHRLRGAQARHPFGG